MIDIRSIRVAQALSPYTKLIVTFANGTNHASFIKRTMRARCQVSPVGKNQYKLSAEIYSCPTTEQSIEGSVVVQKAYKGQDDELEFGFLTLGRFGHILPIGDYTATDIVANGNRIEWLMNTPAVAADEEEETKSKNDAVDTLMAAIRKDEFSKDEVVQLLELTLQQIATGGQNHMVVSMPTKKSKNKSNRTKKINQDTIKQIRFLRKSKMMTMAKISEKTGVSISTVNRYIKNL